MAYANVGGFDRLVRLVAGALLLAAGVWMRLTDGGMAGVMVGGAGALLLVSGITRFCILYVPFGISTRPANSGACLKCH